jgi:hypothetical protein
MGVFRERVSTNLVEVLRVDIRDWERGNLFILTI